MFDAMNESIREETAKMVMRVRVRKNEEVKREQVAKVTGTSGASDGSVSATVKKEQKVGRNDPCPCGSGKKYKRCCGADE